MELCTSGVVRVKLLGGSPPPPPSSHTFLPLGLGRVSCRRHNMQWPLRGHCAIHLGGWGRYKPPKQFHGRVLVQFQGLGPLDAPKNLHLTVPKSESNNAQQYVYSYAFFHVHCSTKSQENPKGPKFSILKFLIRKKMCMFHSSSCIIFLKFKIQAI